ncbi:MAG: glycosyltransferase family 4 protein [Parafilimonas sp.]
MSNALKPNVAIVTNIAWNIYNFRRALALAIKDAGYNPIFMAAPDPYAERLTEEGYTFIPFANLQRAGINPFKDLQLLRDFIKAFKTLNIKCALLYNAKPLVYGSLAASYLKIPYIPTITGLAGPFSGNRFFISKITTMLYRFSLLKSCKIVFQNKEDRNFFLDKKITQPENTFLIEGSGVDMEKFRAELYGLPPEDKIVFLMFGRLSRAKGIEYYVSAAKAIRKKYSNVVFRLAGPFDNDKLAISREKVEEWHQQAIIEYLGVSDFVQNEISEAHVIVYPSYYREGIPKSLIESAAMSRPIITTNNVGCREVVQQGVNGFLIPMKNTQALIDACENFIQMPGEVRDKLGKASRQIAVERFDEKKVIAEYLKLINNCMV